jgi:multidrug resistance protein MdtO
VSKAATTSGVLPGAVSLFLRELVASPRRWRVAIRLAAGATLATAFVSAFHIPHGEYLVVILFLVGVSDAWGSLRRAGWRLAAFVVGVVLVVASLAAFSDKPWILFPLQCVLLGAVIFASRTTTVPYAPVLLAVCFLLTVPEYIAEPGATMEAAVWSLGMIGLGFIGGTVLQLVLWREGPQDLLLDDFSERFLLVEQVLANALDVSPDRPRRPVHGLVAATGIARQLQLLEDAEDESPFLRERHTEQLKLVTDVQLLVRGALQVEQAMGEHASRVLLTAQVQARLRRVQAAAASLREALQKRQLAESPVPLFRPEVLPAAGAEDARSSELEHALEQMEQALDAMPDRLGLRADAHLRPSPPLPPAETLAARPVITSAFRLDNVDEVHVALKAALAIAICGLTYETLAWPGISACVFAILLLAQGSVGASLERSIVQICGVLLGAGWAFLVVVVAMPNMTSLASLLVLLFPLYLAVSWLAFGGGVTTAAALQMAMAAILVLLSDLGPTTNLIPARDRVVGILFGNVVFAAINLSLWPVYAGNPVRLAHLIGDLGKLEERIAQGDHPGARLQAFAIHRSVAQALTLQDQARFEPLPPGVRSTLLHLTGSVQNVFQEVLDTGRAQWTPAVQALSPAVRAPMEAFAQGVAKRLASLADCFQRGSPLRTESLDGLWQGIQAARSQVPAPEGQATASLDAFLLLSRRLVLAVSQLEDVVGTYTGLLARPEAVAPRPVTQTL